MAKTAIHSANAPAAIGTYSQAIKVDNTVYLSGQIALDPVTMVLQTETMEQQIHQVFKNLAAVCEAAGGSLNHIVKLTIYLLDLQHYAMVNEIMAAYFSEPYPARAAVAVVGLPKGVDVEMDAVMVV